MSLYNNVNLGLWFDSVRKAKQSCYTPWWRLRERRYSSYSFLALTLDGGEWSASRPGRALLWGKDRGTHCTVGWVGPRASLDTEGRGKILFACRESNPGLPVLSQSYPGSDLIHYSALNRLKVFHLTLSEHLCSNENIGPCCDWVQHIYFWGLTVV
jgi:hypothetical protein